MKISRGIFRPEAVRHQQHRGCSNVVQQGHSHVYARSVLAIREHGTMARTLLAAFSTDPTEKTFLALIEGGFVKSQLTGSPRAQ